MRHAKSDWNQPGLSDKDRPLSARGKTAAPLMAQWLLDQNVVPDRVCCSSAVRTRETWDEMSRVFRDRGVAQEVEPRYDDALYLAPADSILLFLLKDWQQAQDAKVLLVLGHNFGMEHLVSRLAGETMQMPTAAIAIFDYPLEPENESMDQVMDPSRFQLTHFQVPRKLAS